MARRGVMTALQAALAGIGGAAGGYVQMEERKRKQQMEDEERKRRQALEEAGIRAEQRDILRSGGTQIAGMGEEVAGPVPSAIPLSGVGNAFAAAEQAGGPASSRGAMRQTVGGQTFMLPSAAETRAAALANALESARAERGVLEEFKTADTLKEERKAFNVLKKAGKVKGEFDPEYGRYTADEREYRAIRESLATRAGADEGDRVQRLVESTIATMVREGKPGYAGSRTAYDADELKAAARQIREAATMGTAVAADTKGGLDTTGTGSPVRQKASQDSAIPDTLGRLGIDFSDQAYADTLKATQKAPPQASSAAPRAAEPARPRLSAARQRTSDSLVRQRDQLQAALQEVESSGRFGSSIDKLNMRSQLATIERQLRNFGL